MKTYTRIVDEILLEHNRSRSWLAQEINLSRQALNKHWSKENDGALPSHIIDKINEKFNVNLYEMRKTSAQSVIPVIELQEPVATYERTVRVSFTEDEVKNIIMNRDQKINTMMEHLTAMYESLVKEGIKVNIPALKRDKLR